MKDDDIELAALVLRLLMSDWFEEWELQRLNYHRNQMQPAGQNICEADLINDLSAQLHRLRKSK